MRSSKLFGRTLREAPADADTQSYRLMVRAGLLKRVGSGIFAYSPLLWRVVRKVESIIREEMDKIGGQEMNLPVVQPAELWQETGRYEQIGSELVRFKDRAGRNLVLAMTHEEAVTDYVRRDTVSYRQLPFMLYQLQTKFRDEPRARGGLIRVREFIMKDAYSFHASAADLDAYYDEVALAYERFYARVELSVSRVSSDVGMMGGAEAHEYQYLTEVGEDHVVVCAACGYTANIDTAKHQLTIVSEPTNQCVKEVYTPDSKDIPSVARFFGQDEALVLKTLAFMAGDELVLVCLRGDTDLNIAKFTQVAGNDKLRMATEDELVERGLVPGYLSPLGLDHIRKFIDRAAACEHALITGANKQDYHLVNVDPRSFTDMHIDDLSLPTEQSKCMVCGSPLSHSRGIEVGNIFKLGEKYSKLMGATYLDNRGAENFLVMGCYGIGIGRTIASIVEQHSDERGIIWPQSIAPYAIHLLSLGSKVEILDLAESLYRDIQKAGLEVLYDDRDQTPGVKFSDADLLGIPIHVVVSKRSVDAGGVEVRLRKEKSSEVVPCGAVLEVLKSHINNGY